MNFRTVLSSMALDSTSAACSSTWEALLMTKTFEKVFRWRLACRALSKDPAEARRRARGPPRRRRRMTMAGSTKKILTQGLQLVIPSPSTELCWAKHHSRLRTTVTVTLRPVKHHPRKSFKLPVFLDLTQPITARQVLMRTQASASRSPSLHSSTAILLASINSSSLPQFLRTCHRRCPTRNSKALDRCLLSTQTCKALRRSNRTWTST